MAKKLAAVIGQLAKFLGASGRGRALQRHGDLAHQFTLVAPLGGGAMVALQALHLPEGDEDSVHFAGAARGRAVSP
jgi:hypothetical protein